MPAAKTLGGGLFVSGGAVDLPGEEQPGQTFHVKRRRQLARIDVIVLDGVAGPLDQRLFQPRHGADKGFLHLGGQRGRDAVRIDGVIVEALRLEENLVRFAAGKAHDLVLDRRAVARAGRGDLPGIHGRAGEIGADDGVRRLGRAGDGAGDLARGDLVGEEGERHRRIVGRLLLQAIPVDRSAEKAGPGCRS